MSGFMNPLMGGAAAAKGGGARQLPMGFLGNGQRDPLMRLYQQAGVFDDRPNRSDMTIGNSSKDYSFDEAHKSGGDYEVGEGPSVSSGYQDARISDGGSASAAGRRTRAAPGPANSDDPASYLLRGIMDQERRNQDLLIDPTVQGVKTDKGKRRGGSGKSGGAKKGEGKGNYYEDKASGTGVHT